VKNLLYRFTTAAIWVYFTLLFGWLAFYIFTGDHISFIASLNWLAVYYFLPLPLVFLLAIFLRRREVWVGMILGTVAFLRLWGIDFIPKPVEYTSNPTLTVMTYNVLGYHEQTRPVIDTIRLESPDIVLLQELNPVMAEALQAELGDDYPFQVLDPLPGVTGMGAISKFPIRLSSEKLPLNWVGTPQVLAIDWQGREITVVNFHMLPTNAFKPDVVTFTNRAREAQAQALVDLARRSGSVIIAGDANASPLSEVYRILTAELNDAWRAGGFGLGHTFPGSDIPGSSRPRIAGRPVPQWLVRIDYVFYASPWNVLEARLARFDEVSDHCGVVAKLTWAEK